MTENEEKEMDDVTEEVTEETQTEEKIEIVEEPEEEKVEIVEEESTTDDQEEGPAGEEEIEIVDEEPEEDEDKIEIVDEEEEDEEEYRTRMKPELTDDEVRNLNIRKKKNMKRPKFRRQEWFRYKRLGDSWRKAKGMHSKTRRHYRYRPNVPSVGFRGPKATRNRHSSGFEEVIIHNPKGLDDIDPKRQAARIAHTVGTRKRVEIERKAKELEIRILNRGL
jgi:large subunit ribosomal protein L32e